MWLLSLRRNVRTADPEADAQDLAYQRQLLLELQCQDRLRARRYADELSALVTS